MIFDVLVNSMWILSWLVALYFAISHGITTYKDWQAIVLMNVQNGRRVIAKGNLRTMVMLIGVCSVNLFVGIVSTSALLHFIAFSELMRFVNVGCFLLTAILILGIVIGKKHDRDLWDKSVHKPYDHLDR